MAGHTVKGRREKDHVDCRMSRATAPRFCAWLSCPNPEPGPGQLLVEVAAAGVNYVDTYHRSGIHPIPLPFVPGREGAGIVTAIGSEVSTPRGGRPGGLGDWPGQLRGAGPSSRRSGRAGTGRNGYQIVAAVCRRACGSGTICMQLRRRSPLPMTSGDVERD